MPDAPTYPASRCPCHSAVPCFCDDRTTVELDEGDLTDEELAALPLRHWLVRDTAPSPAFVGALPVDAPTALTAIDQVIDEYGAGRYVAEETANEPVRWCPAGGECLGAACAWCGGGRHARPSAARATPRFSDPATALRFAADFARVFGRTA